MNFDVFVGVLLLSIIFFGFVFQKPMRKALVRKLAKAFVDVFLAHFAKEHTYQRGSYELKEDKTKNFYQERQNALESCWYSHVGDTENISLRPILPGGGYFQRHFIDKNHETCISIFHLCAKQKRLNELVHGLSASTYFNTGTVISSICVEEDKHQIPDNLPSKMIFNTCPFDTSVEDFIKKHQHEVELYLENNEGSQINPVRDLEDALRLANDKQKMVHDHIWQDGDPISTDYIGKNIDPRFSEMIPEIKREIDVLLEERDLT